jgi:uncharacterized protein (TIGR00369 family)
MPALNPDHLKSVMEIINQAPFFRHLSMTVTELGIGCSTVVAEIGKKHMNPFGALHGGVYSSLIDTAAYWSAYCDLPQDSGLVSIDLNIDFLAPVIDPIVVVKGKRLKAGKTIYLAEAQMFNGTQKLVAHGTSKLMAISNQQTIHDAVDYTAAEGLPSKFLRDRHAA